MMSTSISVRLRHILLATIACSATWAGCGSELTDDEGLPPDPGAAGERTLSGIDSDEDGLRDDVQRHIALEYEDPATRDALAQVAEPMMLSYTAGTDRESILSLNDEISAGIDCTHSILDADATQAIQELEAIVLNTPARIQARADADAEISGTSFLLPDDLTDLGAACTR